MTREGFVFPLSYGQQRLWFFEQFEAGAAVYNLPFAYRLHGLLNIRAMEAGINEIVKRHETLRTTFAADQGRPLQIVAPSLTLSVEFIDLRQFSASSREIEASQFLARECRRPFDLGSGPLLRAYLLSLADEEHVLLFVMHHIVSDAWSIRVLLEELSAAYNACLNKRFANLPELPCQYGDFALWQRESLGAAVLERQLSYWKQRLKDCPTFLSLPADYNRPATQTYRGGSHRFTLSSHLAAELANLSRRRAGTSFMTYIAAFAVLLYRYTRQPDIVIGTPIAGRNKTELEGLIGFFINTLVLRNELASNLTFAEVLQGVRESTLGAYANQDVPFERLVEELRPERNLSHSPLFQVLFQLRRLEQEPLKLEGVVAERIDLDTGIAKFDLALEVLERPQGVSCWLRYNSDLFAEVSARRMGEHFERILQQAAANSGRPISDIELVTLAEPNRPVTNAFDDVSERPDIQSIADAFEAQVRKTPQHVAVKFENQSLTYGELNARANRVAHRLIRNGIGPDVAVGVFVPRSLELVVAILGILKAGGAYVPLDPEYPSQRLAHMIVEADMSLLITTQKCRGRLPEFTGDILYVDEEAEGRQVPLSDPTRRLEPENLAYVMYTSGSTGKPKGVLGHHRGVLNYLSYLKATYPLGGTDTVLQIPSAAFDASIRDMLAPLTMGATILMLNEFDAREPAALLSHIQRKRVTCIFSIVPTLLHAVVDTAYGDHQLVDSIRLVLVSGESLTRADSKRFQEVFGARVRLVNQYGPTECTMTSSYYALKEDEFDWSVAPLGTAIPNVRLCVMDPGLQLTPAGPGEICIGGVGVTRGYLNSPELTAEKFVPDPSSPIPGARLYRTGDLGQYRADGSIAFLGRIDHQVKVRGYRVELGEIEAVLKEHKSVKEVVVTASDDGGDNKRLVAYIVPRVSGSIEPRDLTQFLKIRLPRYMVPDQFMYLDKLPLTANRKVDRRSLPEPVSSREQPQEFAKTARTPIELNISGIWGEVLGREVVGVDENFFEVGGHSLQATQVAARLRKAFNVDFPLRQLFEAPTIAGIADYIESARRSKQTSEASAITPILRERDFPLSFTQRRLWFLEQMDCGSPLYNISAAFRLTGPVNIAVMEKSINEIVRRHAVLRTSFAFTGGEPVQTISSFLNFKVPVDDIEFLTEKERAAEALRLATEEARCPFNLALAPLLRVRMIRLVDKDHVLLLTLHHMIADGWSLEILYRELSCLYETFLRNERSPLEDLRLQFVDFAIWQRHRLQGAVLDDLLSYWRKQLVGAPLVLDLPTDRSRPPIARSLGASRRLTFPKTLMDSLHALSQEKSATASMTLLTAFAVLIYRYTGQKDLLIGSLTANRISAEVEPLIGYFASPLPIRVRLAGNPTLLELLSQVRETVLGAYEHQELPFEKLVEELEPQRTLSRNPVFQVAFSFQRASAASLNLPEIAVTPLTIERGTAKFDLTMHLVEGSNDTRAVLEYNTDLFDAPTIERMLNHYHMLLNGIIDNPSRTISKFAILTGAEERQVLSDWNDCAKDYDKDQCIQRLIESQVDRSPDAIAVVFEGERLSYRELNRRVNQLAHYLKKSGVGPEDRVGICLDRSTEMLVSILAVLKAGGAYVPLDPAYPRERLEFMLEDSRAVLLVTRAASLPAIPRQKVVCLESEKEQIAREPDDNLPARVTIDNLAYVIYTSGSTGRPKGVQITHRSLLNAFCSMRDEPGIDRKDIFLATSSFSFDIAALELLLPLIVGARVAMIGREAATDAIQLQEVLTRSGATVMQATPATWRLLIDGGWNGASHLRVQCGGETLSGDLARNLMTRCSSLWNLYGPTETTIYSTAHRVTATASVVPIGRPIANTQIYLLDPWLAPVPVGVAAQVYIGGDGLARGYLNLPDLTAEKFIPNPFSRMEGERLYQTGDFARYLPDGNIEFLGRSDDQVKIRGFRIELGEIEAALTQHPDVQGAVVTAVDNGKEKTLVAYVVTSKDRTIAVDNLRRHLKAKLPDGMIPSVFSMVRSFPLTANGKIDRGALPAPNLNRPDLSTAFVAPRSALQKVLAKSWLEVLSVDRVGIHDNFFDLGGHSISAMEVVAKISHVINKSVSPKLLFMHPTIEELSTALNEPARDEKPIEANQHDRRLYRTKISPASSRERPGVVIERRPLLSLIASGRMPPVDSAALGYLSEETLDRTGLAQEVAVFDWFDSIPTVSWVLETSLGRIALITLPCLRADLYQNKENLVALTVEALEISRQIGAKSVSLMGLLPSAMDYGHAVTRAISNREGLPLITTGHATTVSAMVLTLERILALAGRNLAEETVAFIGLGAIGTATLRLMLRCLPQPRAIMLCDLYSKVEELEKLGHELARSLPFAGAIEIVPSARNLPAKVYDASVLVGATNVPDLLEVRSIRPGTLIVDDSAPHCFKPQEVIQRFQDDRDILFSAGGAVQAPQPVHRIRYLPRHIEAMMTPGAALAVSDRNPYRLAGCAFSSLLLSRFPELAATVGIVDEAASLEHYKLLSKLGYRSAELHCGNYSLPESLIGEFRSRFGRR